MNKERATALLKWVNSVSSTTVQSIRDFSSPTNTRILINILHLIDRDNKDVGTSNKGGSTVQEMVSYILASLQGIYHNLDGIVSSDLIASNDNDLEIGKLITLLLCGAVQGNNVLHFIEKIHKLDNKVQCHLKVIIENILQQVEMGQLCSRSLANLLQEQVVFKDDQECTGTQDGMFSPSLTNSPFRETVFSNSPLVSLMLSPQMKSKQNQFIENKLHQKVKKLQMDLDAQHHIQSTMEEELAEKNKDLDTKNANIRELKKELVQVRMVVDELESLEHFKNDFEKVEKENNKLKHRIAELEDFKVQHSNLDERTASFLKEKDKFEKQVKEVNLIQARCERYKQQTHQLEFQASELQAALNRREEEIEKLIKERDEALHAATESTELWKSRQVPDPFADEDQMIQAPPSPLKAPNLDSRLIELEFENERLKKQMTTAIDPLELQRIKEELEDVKQSKKSFEGNFVEAKCKILELEERMAQQQDQSRIREEALQKEMSQDCESKIRNVTEELNSIHDQERKAFLQKLDDFEKKNDSLQVEFSLELEKQRQLLKKTEDDGNQVKEMYEKMLEDVKNELVNEVKKSEDLNTAFQQTKRLSDKKTIDFQQEKYRLSTEMSQCKEKVNHLMEDAVRLKQDIECALQREKVLKEKETTLKKEVEGLQTSGQEMRGEIDRLNGEIKSLKENESKYLKERSSFECTIAALKEKEVMMLEEKVQFSLEVASLKRDFTTELKSMTESLERDKVANLSKMKNITEDLYKKIDKANKDIAERDQSVKEFTQKCSKLKLEIDAAESRLLSVTRERNAMSGELEKASHGLKAAADNIEELRETIQEAEKKVAQEKAKVKNLEGQLEKERSESKRKHKTILDEGSKKYGDLEAVYDNERKKLEEAGHGLKAAADNIEELRETVQEAEKKLSQEKTKVINLEEQLEKERRESKQRQNTILDEASKKYGALEKVYDNERKMLEKAGHELKAATDNIEELKKSIEEAEQKVSQEKAKVKNLEEQLEKQRDEWNEKQKILFEEASKKNRVLEEGYEKERNNLKRKLETATEESVALRKKLFESSQDHSSEMMELRRLSQEKEEYFDVEEKKMRDEIRGFIANLANERVTNSELQDKLKQSENQRDELKKTLEEMKKALKLEIDELKKKVEVKTTPLEEMKHSFETLKEEKQNILSEYEQSKARWIEKETELNSKVSESMNERVKLKEMVEAAVRNEDEMTMMNEHVEKLEHENSELEDLLQEERVVSRRLGAQVKSLEAQLQHAELTLREQKQTLQNIHNQSENFKKKKQMHNFEEFVDESSSTDEDADMKIDDLGMKNKGSTASFASTLTNFTESTSSLNSLARSSLCSTSSTHGRAAANRRQSAVYLKGSTPPTQRTTSSAAFFVGDEFARDMEEEPLDHGYDWERLAELERRNTICPPHLKTSYPIETQTRPNVENETKNTLLSSISDPAFRTRKRKSLSGSSAAMTYPKLHKPQPNSKSDGHLKRSKSKRIADRMSSKINSLRSRDNQNKEAENKRNNGGNVAFSIDITPPSNKPSKNNVSLRSFRTKKEPETPTKQHIKNKPVQGNNTAFMIENSPPNKNAKSTKCKRRRTINRSTASTQLVCEKDKEACKTEKKQEYLKRKPLRQTDIN